MNTQATHDRLEHQNSTSGVGWKWLAYLSFIITVLIIVGTVISLILVQGQGNTTYAATTVTGIVITLANCIVALLIVNRYSTHKVGWLLLVTGWMFAIRLLGRIPIFLANGRWITSSTDLVVVAQWFEQWNYIPAFLLPIIFLPIYFPTGRLLSPRWRIVPGVGGAVIILLIAGVIISPSGYINAYEGINPFQFKGGQQVGSVLVYPLVLLFLVALGGAILSLIQRYHRSEGIERKQQQWLFLPLGMYIVWNLGILAPIELVAPDIVRQFHNTTQYADFWLISTCIPVVIGIAILRHNLFDIEIAINRALVYGVMTTLIVLLYVAIISYVGLLVEAWSSVVSGLIATAIVAVLFQPLRELLQKLTNRVLYGERDEPEVLFSRLAQNLERADSSSTILPNFVRTIAEALKIPYAAILVSDENRELTTLAAWGKPPEECETIPLTYNKAFVGYLVVAPRHKHEQFTRQERTLLNTIASLTATTLRSVQLTDELRQSRQRIVNAREEERLRIRRDLHDGLGPSLAAHMIQVGTAQTLVKRDPEAATNLLEELENDLEHSLNNIRRLVYNLRPPALDQLGLIPALDAFIEQCNQGKEGGKTDFELVVPPQLSSLPAAVEVAAYRIVQEAISNVLRHAQAKRCTVNLKLDEGLRITVEDNGIGLPAPIIYGVGMTSMRERADELDGSFTIESQLNQGTCINVRLPYAAVNDVPHDQTA